MNALMLTDTERLKLRQDCFNLALDQCPSGTKWGAIFTLALRYEGFFLNGVDPKGDDE